MIGGEGGIRTHDTVDPYTHFPGVLLRPLGHLSTQSALAGSALPPSVQVPFRGFARKRSGGITGQPNDGGSGRSVIGGIV